MNQPASTHKLKETWDTQDSMAASLTAARDAALAARAARDEARNHAKASQDYHGMITDRLGPVAVELAQVQSAATVDRQDADRRLKRLESRETDGYVRSAVIGGVSAVFFSALGALMFGGQSAPVAPARVAAPAPVQYAAPVAAPAVVPVAQPVRVAAPAPVAKPQIKKVVAK